MQDQMTGSAHLLSYYDLLLTPIYFVLILFWIIYWKKKRYQNSPLKKYIIPAFILKSICCVLLACLYNFYYGYSDSQFYFNGAIEIWNATKANPVYGLELVFKPLEKCSQAAQQFASHMSNEDYVSSMMNMFKFSGFVGMFCFGTYLPVALFFTLLSFIGSWKIFLVFAEEFPAHYNKIALSCLFAPSFIFWSTNVLKDPLCIFGLGLCVSALYNFMKGRFTFFLVLEMVTGAIMMLLFKNYIFYIFCVAAVFSVYINLITSSVSRFKIFFKLGSLFLLFFAVAFLFWQKNYIIETLSGGFMNEVLFIQNSQKNQGGSVYVLSNVDDFSFWGILKTYFSSLTVALFRPYIWEIPNLIATANALESLLVFIFTFYLLIKLKFTGFFSAAFKNRILTFSLIFTLLLAPLAGLVSFNFGTLVRYKAPVVPFYYTYLILLYYTVLPHKKVKEKEQY
ncbi:MAG: hypothetical protein JWR61_5479 [Ferruginibacter sp.]|nr:hypothetical protein [Ferruginibacter sp.]